jgi:hypothetical protein
MTDYYAAHEKLVEDYLPKTFHIRYGVSDHVFSEFEQYYHYIQRKQEKQYR